MEKNKKNQNPVRFRAARIDATVESIIKRIERDFKLPSGSVKLVLPNGRKAHLDGKISNLLDRWNY
jgi:hypothetical protein